MAKANLTHSLAGHISRSAVPLLALGGMFFLVMVGAADNVCLTPVSTVEPEGPYYVSGVANRQLIVPSDYAFNATAGLHRWTVVVEVLGTPAEVVDGTLCCALPDAIVDVWHAGDATTAGPDPWIDAAGGGAYSKAASSKWFRGKQTTNASGVATFSSLYPLVYTGRPIKHLHFKIWVPANRSSQSPTVASASHVDSLTSQFYFQSDKGVAPADLFDRIPSQLFEVTSSVLPTATTPASGIFSHYRVMMPNVDCAAATTTAAAATAVTAGSTTAAAGTTTVAAAGSTTAAAASSTIITTTTSSNTAFSSSSSGASAVMSVAVLSVLTFLAMM